jgi:L-ribulokinase
MFAAVAAGNAVGGYPSISAAQKSMTGFGKAYQPNEENHRTYVALYKLYCQLHDAFGTKEWTGSMVNVMKELLTLRDSIRKGK